MQTELCLSGRENSTYTPQTDSEVQYDWDEFFSGVDGFSDDEIVDKLGASFDELTARAAEGQSDEEVFTAIRSLVGEVQSRGYVEQAMQMAMTLGAMACTHNHLQGLANEIGGNLFGVQTHDKDDGHDHDRSTDKESHNAKTCDHCKAGRTCRKK